MPSKNKAARITLVLPLPPPFLSFIKPCFFYEVKLSVHCSYLAVFMIVSVSGCLIQN